MAGPDPEEALYAEPPDRFVAARDALARALRDAGDRAGAKRVRALRRPTRAAWAVNVAVRERPDTAGELTDAAADLGGAQRELLSGGGPARLREAQARVEAACSAIVAAVPVDDPPTLEKVRQTLRAAAVDADVLAEVTSGRLLRERVASGFGDVGGFVVPPPGDEAGSAAPSAAAAATRDADQQQAARRAEQQAARRAEEQAARRAEAERAAQEAAERAAEARRARLAVAREQESSAEAAAVAARQALQEAEAALASRHAELAAAEERLTAAVREREQAESD
jgi:hypothetical protein